MTSSRLPYVRAMIESMGLDAFLDAEVAAVRTRPVPMRLAESVERASLKLTPHEVRVLSLLAQGLTRREVAEMVRLSHGALKEHLGLTFAKLGARNLPHALALATEAGYLS